MALRKKNFPVSRFSSVEPLLVPPSRVLALQAGRSL